jgi:ABC-2 type transport system permease protein
MLIALTASFNNSGEFNVLTLLGLWVGLTLIIPAAGSSVAEALYPAPSRLAYLAEAREVENEARLREADVSNEFMLDHPELLVDLESEFPAYVSSAFLVTSTVDAATRPIVE